MSNCVSRTTICDSKIASIVAASEIVFLSIGICGVSYVCTVKMQWK